MSDLNCRASKKYSPRSLSKQDVEVEPAAMNGSTVRLKIKEENGDGFFHLDIPAERWAELVEEVDDLPNLDA